MPLRIANKQDPDQTAYDCLFKSSLIWISAVCFGLFGRQLVFEILEHLSYLCSSLELLNITF